jgi:hypothetical protein
MNLNPILERASSSDFMNYAPQAVVDAVNALHPLGKDGALHAIDAYLAQADQTADHHGLFLVMRVLFEVPADPGYHPPVRIGGSNPPPPKDPKSLPRFPILLIDDIPLMLVSGYALGGDPEPLAVHIQHFRDRGTLRAQPLKPSKSKDALARYEATYRSAYGAGPSAREIAFVQGQLDRM